VQASAITAQHDDGKSAAVHDCDRNLEPHAFALRERSLRNRLRHGEGNVLLREQSLRGGSR
jgi:hypothetical protein